jgi:cytochrome c oxidase subunit 2
MEGIILAIVLFVITIATSLVTFLGPWGLPVLASNWGSIDAMMIVTTIVTVIAFIGVNGVMGYYIYRYRSRQGQKATYLVDDHKLEKILIGITSIGIIALLAPGLFVYSKIINPPSDAHTIEVISQQWKWGYRYAGADGKLGHTNPKLITSKNLLGIDLKDPNSLDDVFFEPTENSQLHLPINKAVKIELRSNDILHSFYVPQFRVKIDTVPGEVTHLWFTPNLVGRFEVLCAELCGIRHYKMKSHVIVQSEGDFQNWLKQQPTVAQVLGNK